jgi:hypothetical protein
MGPNSEKWLGAVKSKMESMHGNQVWNSVDPIDGVRPGKCKWIFKKKLEWIEIFISIKRDGWRKV